ncbi:MAG: Phosphocarrier protein HPr [Eubacteriales bacterium]|jgi:phosphocarrier protein HPr
MKTFEYTVKDEAGLHARPAGLLVKFAQGCSSDINLVFNGKTADAKRLFSVMALGAKKDNRLVFEVSGAQEEEECAKLQEFCTQNF